MAEKRNPDIARAKTIADGTHVDNTMVSSIVKDHIVFYNATPAKISDRAVFNLDVVAPGHVDAMGRSRPRTD